VCGCFKKYFSGETHTCVVVLKSAFLEKHKLVWLF